MAKAEPLRAMPPARAVQTAMATGLREVDMTLTPGWTGGGGASLIAGRALGARKETAILAAFSAAIPPPRGRGGRGGRDQPAPVVLVSSRLSRGGRAWLPSTRNHTFSAMLVAW